MISVSMDEFYFSSHPIIFCCDVLRVTHRYHWNFHEFRLNLELFKRRRHLMEFIAIIVPP